MRLLGTLEYYIQSGSKNSSSFRITNVNLWDWLNVASLIESKQCSSIWNFYDLLYYSCNNGQCSRCRSLVHLKMGKVHFMYFFLFLRSPSTLGSVPVSSLTTTRHSADHSILIYKYFNFPSYYKAI